MNPFMEEVLHDFRQSLINHDADIAQASNLDIIKDQIDDLEDRYIQAGSNGLFKAEKLVKELFVIRDNIDEYVEAHPEVVNDTYHFVVLPRPNGQSHLLSYDEALYHFATGEALI